MFLTVQLPVFFAILVCLPSGRLGRGEAKGLTFVACAVNSALHLILRESLKLLLSSQSNTEESETQMGD